MTTPAAPTPGEGRRLFELLTRQGEWIHRRVDRTDLEPDGETTRRRSFDVTVRDDLAIEREGGVVVPLTLMTKTPLRRLDTSGPDGRPLPVLGRHDNGQLVSTMLIQAFRGMVVGVLPTAVEDAVQAAVMENDPHQMPGRVEILTAAVNAQPAQDPQQREAVLALASDLAQQFLFAVLLPREYVGTRTVLKVSVTEDVTGAFPDWAFSRDGRSMDLPLSLAESASSAHFEFRAPLGLRVASVRLLDARDEELDAPGPSITMGRTVHLTGLEQLASPVDTAIRARVELEPVADGFVRQTSWATAFVAALLLVGAGQVDLLADALAANRGGSVAAAALAVPALFLSVQSRRPEHSWVARALFVPRLINIATAAVLYCAAIYLVTVSPDDPHLDTVMWVFFAVQVVPAVIATALLRVVSAQAPTVHTN
jgi:hypothetical protein